MVSLTFLEGSVLIRPLLKQEVIMGRLPMVFVIGFCCLFFCSNLRGVNAKERIYIPKCNIFLSGEEVVVHVRGKAFTVPCVYNAFDKRGYFTYRRHLEKSGAKFFDKGKIWQCWCGATFTSKEELQQHRWEEAHGPGLPPR